MAIGTRIAVAASLVRFAAGFAVAAALLTGAAHAASLVSTKALAVELTEAERAWIKAHPKIVFGVDADWEPMLLRNPDGSLAGIDGDTVTMLNAMLGTNIVFETGKWSELVEKLRKRQIDGLSSSAVHEERRAFADFTDPYLSFRKFVFVTKENPGGIVARGSLAGKRIAFQTGNLFEKKTLESYPGVIAVPIWPLKTQFEAALAGKVDGFVGGFSTEYQLNKEANPFFRPAYPLGEVIHLVFSVRKDWPELTSILNKALLHLPIEERDRIKRRYVEGITAGEVAEASLMLSAAERAWLAARHTVRVRISDWPPYMFTRPVPSGKSVDYLNAVAKRFGFKVEYVPTTLGTSESMWDVREGHRLFDLLPTISRTPEREAQFALTSDYLTMPLVIFTRKDSPFISGLGSLKGKTVAMDADNPVADSLTADAPGINRLAVARPEDALRMVATGQADAYVGNLVNASYLIKEYGFNNLVVAAPTPYGDHTEAMAVRKDWPELASLISKGIAAMTQDERNAIRDRWMQVETRPQIDYTLAWQVFAAAALMLAAFFYWNRKLSREIGRRQLVEAELRQAKEAAEAASRAKSTFLANMSHELRTPMHAIMGMTTLAQRRAVDPKQRDHLARVEHASKHLLSVINDILDISKIEAERLVLERTNFRLDRVTDDLQGLIGQRAAEKGIALDFDVPHHLAVRMFLGDSLRLGQILLNLAGNAVKFTDAGAVTVRVRLLEDTAEGALLRWEVQDTGIGIAPAVQARLFTAFEQADGSLTRKYGGTGLGLAISKRLAQLMGGEIGLESVPGAGSTFWFTVRLGQGGGAVPPAPTFAGPTVEQRIRAQHGGACVLLVEDEPTNQVVARSLLEEAGLEVDLAEDGAAALELARRKPYDLILMDMQMPVMNGLEATRAIRANSLNAATPILAMTANAYEEDRQTCIAAGMNDFIGKPVTPEVLQEAALKWLERE